MGTSCRPAYRSISRVTASRRGSRALMYFSMSGSRMFLIISSSSVLLRMRFLPVVDAAVPPAGRGQIGPAVGIFFRRFFVQVAAQSGGIAHIHIPILELRTAGNNLAGCLGEKDH